jgi:hypothetical protein
MTNFSLAELKLLAAHGTAPCVSIYMPVNRINARPLQDAARLNHFIKQAEGQIVTMGLSQTEAEAILAPARELSSNHSFWHQPRAGIALFMAPEFFYYFDETRMAIEFSEQVCVSDHFLIKPLLPLLTDNGQFYVLVLNQKQVRLLYGTRDTVTAIHLVGVPQDIHEALGEKMAETETQGRPMDVGDHHEKFGFYDPTLKEKDRILRYFRIINAVVHTYLANKQAPLLLAGMAFEHAIYREANTYPHLLAQGIAHNAENVSDKELHRLAWEIVAPLFREARQQALDRFQNSVTSGKTSTQLSEILEAAEVGRIDTLFLAEDNPPVNTQLPGSADLINEATAQTIINGGTVYILEPEALPDLLTMPAATLRY